MASGIPPLLPASPPPMNEIDAADESDSDGSDSFSPESFVNFSVDAPATTPVDTQSATSSNLPQNDRCVAAVEHSILEGDQSIPQSTDYFTDGTSSDIVPDGYWEITEPPTSCCESGRHMSDENSVFVTIKSGVGDEMTVPVTKEDDDVRYVSNIGQYPNSDGTHAFHYDDFDLHDHRQIDVLPSDRIIKNYNGRSRLFSMTSSPSTLTKDSSDFVNIEEIEEPLSLPGKNNFDTGDQVSRRFDQKSDADENLSTKMLWKPNEESDHVSFYGIRHDDDACSKIENQDRYIETSSIISSTNYVQNSSTFSDPVSEGIDGNTFEKDCHDYDDNDDDDFSDFVSPINFVNEESNFYAGEHYESGSRENLPIETTRQNSNSQNVLPFLSLGEILSTVNVSEEDSWSDIFGHSCENAVQVNVNTIEGKLKFSSVWCTIKDVQASPALKYNWNDSETNKILLSALYIDRKNIYFAPKWNSEVPRFASNLGFVPLIPQKTTAIFAAAEENRIMSEIQPIRSREKEEMVCPALTSVPINTTTSSLAFAVPDARFDWSDSGLTNPLDTRKFEKSNDHDNGGHSTTGNIYEITNSTQFSASEGTKQISDDVTQILDSLPDLVVMEKQYIVFPIR